MNHGAYLYCLILFSSSLFAQTGDNVEQKEVLKLQNVLEEIVVQGELVEQTSTRVVISSKEIKERGVRTVAQALDYLPGADVQIGSKGDASIILRGFHQREIAVLIDGVPVNSPYDGQIDLSSLPIGDVERIEVIKGASSVLYGANAMGGVVNVITKRSNGNRSSHLQGGFGSGDLVDMSGSTQGSFGPMRYFLSGSYSDQDSYPLSGDYSDQIHQDRGNRSNSDRQIWTGKAGLGWDVGEENRLAFNVSHIDQVRGIPHHESSSKPRFWRFTDWQQGGVDMVWDRFGDKYSIKTKVYHEFLDNVLDSYDDASYTTQEGRGGWTDYMENSTLGSDLFFRYTPRDSLLLKAGLRVRQDENKRRSEKTEPWERHELSTLSLPLELEWQKDQFNITSGFSYDIMTFDYGDLKENKETDSFNPQIAILFNLNDNANVRGSVSHKTRFPTVRELFSSKYGNPDLEPMQSTSYEIGLENHLSSDWTLKTTAFYHDITDLISWVSFSSPYMNINEAVFYGVELETKFHWSEKLVLACGYTYLHTEDRSSTIKDQIEYRPEHKFNGNVHLNLPARFTLNVNLMMVSSQIYYIGNDAVSMDAYNLMDSRLVKEIDKRYSLFLEVKNLFDENYDETEGFPRQGRTVGAGFHLNF